MKGGLSNLVTVTFLFSKESSSHIVTIFFHLLAAIIPMLISTCIKVLSRPFLRNCFRPRISDSIYCTENNSLENSQAAGYIDYPCIFFQKPKSASSGLAVDQYLSGKIFIFTMPLLL